jgi:site-specific recombinase XerC
MTSVERLDDFLHHLRGTRDVSPHTLRAYASDRSQFGAWLAERGVASSKQVGYEEVKRRSRDSSVRGSARTSVARKAASVRPRTSVSRPRRRNRGRPRGPPAARPSSPKAPALDDAAVLRLLSAPMGDDFAPTRDRAVLELLYSAGLRNAEAAAFASTISI